MEALKLVGHGRCVLTSSNKLCKQSTPFLKHSPHLYHQEKKSARRLAVRATNSHISIREINELVKERNESMKYSLNKGLGIVDFLKAKNFLITGATGFLAKVVIEKILRTQPQVGKLFLIIKAKDSDAALHRLKNEIIGSELFRCLRDIYEDHYEGFVLSKLIPVVGDVSLDNLGIQENVADKLVQHVDIIINTAANTSFDARYDVALETNTKGPSRLMEFGRNCRKLQLFLHVSTAYANGQRHGRIVEKPFKMGESLAKEMEDTTALDILHEFELVKRALNSLDNRMIESKSYKALNENTISQSMKDMALERARTYGWQDVYVFSKAMGEMFLDYNRGEIPLAIVRPSVIEGTYNDPFPGWIEGCRMFDPVIAYYGKGQLSAVIGDPDVALDMVPVDMVANAIIATMAKHAGKAGLKVYHMASSVANPIVLRDLFEMLYQYFKAHPYVDESGKSIKVKDSIKLFDNMEDLSSYGVNMSLNECGLPSLQMEKQECIALKVIDRVNKYISGIYQSYSTYNGRFDNSNMDLLFQELSQQEKKMFGFDVKSIEWKNYIMNIHIPGFLENVTMKERAKAMQQGKNPTTPIITRP